VSGEIEMQAPPDSARPPRTRSWERVAAGAVILIGSLGLTLIGGGFLVGVLSVVRADLPPGASPTPLSPGESALVTVLYVLAFACFAAALALLCLGMVGLCRVLWEKQVPSGPDPGSPAG
jgi:hypothetical protein